MTPRQHQPARARRADFFPALAALLALVTAARAATFNATLDRDTIAVGESATLSLVFEGGSPKTQPQFPGIQNLRISPGGTSTQFTWVNGESKSTATYTYTLTPTQPGDFNLPPVEVKVGDETLRSPPIILKAVRAAAATPDAAGAEDQLVLIKLVLPKKQFYLGEVVPVELDVYLRDRVLGIQQSAISPLAADGFTFSKTVQGAQKQTRVGNANFLVTPLVATMTAGKTGSFTINPVDATLVVELPGTKRQPDQFDPFGVFQRNEARRITLSSQPETVEVLPLPDGAPASFTGAVGNFSLKLNAAPTDIAAGDPVTVKIQINGRGAMDSLTLPPQTAWQDFKTYPPTAKFQPADQLGLQGSKNFEIVVIPENSGVRELPPFEFSYFDPDAHEYRTLRQPAIPLNVRAGAVSAPPPALATHADSAPVTRDIAPIRLAFDKAETARAPLLQRPLFWALQTVPVLAWAALLVRRRRAESLANNPRLRRQQQVAQFIRQGLSELNTHAQQKNSDAFFALLFRLLQEQIGERLDVPASSITESVVDERLRPRCVSAPLLARVHDLFQACNLARYAPVKSSHELEAQINKLEVALDQLGKLDL